MSPSHPTFAQNAKVGHPRKEATRMRTLKRLLVWFLETSLEGALLAVVLVSLFGCDQHAYGRCLAVNFVWIGTMFFSTGYLLSTGIARAIWRGRGMWIYSVVATVLFFIHFEILNYAAGGCIRSGKTFRDPSCGSIHCVRLYASRNFRLTEMGTSTQQIG
jgi:hypothetical protein